VDHLGLIVRDSLFSYSENLCHDRLPCVVLNDQAK
jgi:hypothetical protein